VAVVRVLSIVIAAALIAAPAVHAKGCPNRDARAMVREAGQGLNGRVTEVHDDRIVVVAESTYDDATIAFGDSVTVYGDSLPATEQGRIGIAVRRAHDRWEATRCDVVPGARMARALAGRDPCPPPGVRIADVATDGREVSVTLRMTGDVTDLRLWWDGRAQHRAFAEPGFVMLVERHRFARAGRHRIAVRASGGGGPGCATPRRFSRIARRTVRLR
jgi:hypothetical protein